eukprot:329075-Chlamydomonas_euryale.AAC.2
MCVPCGGRPPTAWPAFPSRPTLCPCVSPQSRLQHGNPGRRPDCDSLSGGEGISMGWHAVALPARVRPRCPVAPGRDSACVGAHAPPGQLWQDTRQVPESQPHRGAER